jgi:23S rRNA pseudouridine1911/1915/1917 synthase
VETSKRYVVPAGRGQAVRDVLVHARTDPHAVAEGRVFVGRKRVLREDEPVNEGDVVEIAAALPASAHPHVTILARTDDLVAVDKPAGVPTIPDHAGAAHALTFLTATALGVDPSRLHATSRLDREVSGVVVFALTKGAAARLTSARARGEYVRRYVAIATSTPEPTSGTWDEPIGRARDPRLRKIGGRDPAPAVTHYSACGHAPGGQTMLSVTPGTGRTHQIRVHAAHAGAPLLGDRAYGASPRIVLGGGRVLEPRRIALHALRVLVPGDSTGSVLTVLAPVPPELRDLWTALGGDERSWDVSTTCA